MSSSSSSSDAVSIRTTGSSQTTIGLGTYSGRAILALGELVVRGMDRFPGHRRSTTSLAFYALSSRSTLSISNMSSPSNLSAGTESSSSTTPGPGELSGKVIKALGTRTLEIVDDIWLRRRLNEISPFFPHGRRIHATVDDGEMLYNNILELARQALNSVSSLKTIYTSFRPGLYSDAVQLLALGYLVIQINAREVTQFIRALRSWDSEDAARLLLRVAERVEWLK
jgi:hypothetical protein